MTTVSAGQIILADHNNDLEDGLSQAMVKIDEEILTGTAASVTFSSIPQTFRTLKLEIVARGDTAASFVSTRLRFNGDSSTIYNSQQDAGNNATAAAFQEIDGAGAQIGEVAAASATSGAVGTMETTIPFYAGTTFWKQFQTIHALSTGAGSATLHAKQWSGVWRSTAAITSITILPTAGNFIAGSSFSLYGMP